MSNSIAHLVRYRSSKNLINYLDDYMFASLLKVSCDWQVQQFLDVCKQISFPINFDKTFWGTTYLSFLGMLIDTVRQMVFVPIEKVMKAFTLIDEVLNKRSGKLTLLQLQKICGFLNFLGKCVVPGCAFTQRLYAHMGKGTLKPYHHIKITQEMRMDLEMWKTFLMHPTAFARPFIDFDKDWGAEKIHFYSDASGRIGLGAICGKNWMHRLWPTQFLAMKPNIEYLELYALVAAVYNWIDLFQNFRIIIFCDNQTVCTMANHTTSSCKNCMTLIRLYTLKCLTANVKVFVQYVRSRDNYFADLLSRNGQRQFKEFVDKGIFNKSPTPVPEVLWPPQKIWKL